jgi:hypothetical protein
MMTFLNENGVYMKMNLASSLRRDSLGFFTHVHPRATWRDDFQKEIIEQMKKNMSSDEIEKAREAADDKDKRELFITLNFRKQYIKSSEGLIQTETLELQTAPQIKEIVNSALFKAAKKNQLPGRFYPYGVSSTLGAEEYRNILKRQNAFLSTTHVVGIQGITEQLLDKSIECNFGGHHFHRTPRELLTDHENILRIEKTNLSGERGKYLLICEKKNEKEVKEYIDKALEYFNTNVAEQVRHSTHPEVRRSSPTKWTTQIQEYTDNYQNPASERLPRNPPNAWNNKIVLVNDLENFPTIQKEACQKTNKPTRQSKNPERQEKEETELQKRLKKIEENINKKFEERIQDLEKKYTDLKNELNGMMDAIDRLAETFKKTEERAQAAADKQLNTIMAKLETITRGIRNETTDQMMEFESTDSRKKTKTGKNKEKKQVEQDDFSP